MDIEELKKKLSDARFDEIMAKRDPEKLKQIKGEIKRLRGEIAKAKSEELTKGRGK